MVTLIGHEKNSLAKCMVVRTLKVESGPILGFRLDDLIGGMDPHNDALSIQAIVAKYDVAQIFIDTSNSVNILF